MQIVALRPGGWDFVYPLRAMGSASSLYYRNEKTLPESFSLNLECNVNSLSEETKNILRESWKLMEPLKTVAGKKMFER